MKTLMFVLHLLLICYFPLQAEIIKTTHIEETTENIPKDALVFFNIAEVLMDSEISLGTQEWRKYLRLRLTPQMHDELTLYVFQNVPAKTPEPETAAVISLLQGEECAVMAFTSRGRNEWYSSQIEGIDQITEETLRTIGIDFSHTKLPSKFEQLNTDFADYYHSGIIYATNAYEKGEILTQLLNETGYFPSHIIFVDDKVNSLKTLEEAASKMGISFTGYAYSRTAKEHAQFDPMIAHIQLDWLISCRQILSDEEAKKIKEEQFKDIDSESYFFDLIKKWNDFKRQL